MVTSCVTLGGNARNGGLQMSAHPVQNFDHARIAALIDRVHWDDLHILQNISLHPSIRRASRELGFAPNTIRAKIGRLEQATGTLLFRRDRDGLQITADGKAILSVAEEMRLLSTGISFGAGNNALVRDGEIRICASEGLGTFWLTPRLSGLKAQLPHLVVSLDSFSDQGQIHPKNHDIAIGFSRPTDPDVIVSRVGFVHMIPFASEDYIRRNGNPASFEEAAGHECVQQDAPGLNYDALKFFTGQEQMDRLVTIRVSSSYSLFWAVASGVGIGALPTYIRSLSRRVIPLALPIQLKFEIWMSYSRMARHSDAVRSTIDWLRSCFDPAQYPWFHEDFIHPDDFTVSFADSQVIPLFDHLIDDPS